MLITNPATGARDQYRGRERAPPGSVSFRGALNFELKIQMSKRNTLKPGATQRNTCSRQVANNKLNLEEEMKQRRSKQTCNNYTEGPKAVWLLY